jgi:hypothetical protein
MSNVLILGDSLCEGIKLSVPFHTEYKHGITTKEIKEQIENNFLCCFEEDDYNIVVLILGMNDLLYGEQVDIVVSNLLYIVEWIRKNKNITKVVTALLHGQESFNNLLSDKLEDTNIHIFPYLEDLNCKTDTVDGVHFTEKTKRKISGALDWFVARVIEITLSNKQKERLNTMLNEIEGFEDLLNLSNAILAGGSIVWVLSNFSENYKGDIDLYFESEKYRDIVSSFLLKENYKVVDNTKKNKKYFKDGKRDIDLVLKDDTHDILNSDLSFCRCYYKGCCIYVDERYVSKDGIVIEKDFKVGLVNPNRCLDSQVLERIEKYKNRGFTILT